MNDSGEGIPLLLRRAGEAEVALLALMNKRLVEDQGSRNPFRLAEFEERFREWLEGGNWQIDLFDHSESTVGYAVHRVQADYYLPEQEVVYLRQFYIESEYRGR